MMRIGDIGLGLPEHGNSAAAAAAAAAPPPLLAAAAATAGGIDASLCRV
jgi:hypothetical protein